VQLYVLVDSLGGKHPRQSVREILFVCHAACSNVSNRRRLTSSVQPGRCATRWMMRRQQPRVIGSPTHGRPAGRMRRTSTAGSHGKRRAATPILQLTAAPGDLG
jgi:hypothetical protein